MLTKPSVLAYFNPDGEGTVKNGEWVPESVPVEGIFLLDPVDRDIFCSGGGIRSNVKRMDSVLRDQTIWEYSPEIKLSDYKSLLDKTLAFGFNVTGQNDPDRYARKFMGNADMSLAPGNTTTRVYKAGVVYGASHGAIGGLPWVERREDEAAAKATARIINHWMADYGVIVSVADNSYTEENKRKYPQVTQAMVIQEKLRMQELRSKVAAAEAAADRLRPTGGARPRF